MLVIDAAAVRELFPMRAAIEQMREALERYSAATIVQPLRTVVRPSRAPGMMAAMPAWAGPDRGFGIKTVTIHPGNPAAQPPGGDGLGAAAGAHPRVEPHRRPRQGARGMGGRPLRPPGRGARVGGRCA